MMLAGYKNAATAHTAKLLSFGPAGSSQTSNPPTLPPDASLINRGFLYLLRIPSNTSLVFESILEAGGDLGKDIDLARVAPDFSIPTEFLIVDDDHKINAIHIAAYAGLTEVVEYLIKGRYVALGPFTYGPLHYALQGRHIETSKTLIQQGADLVDESESALDVAASLGLTEIVVLLVDEKRMDPNGRGIGRNPLCCAVWSGGYGYKDDALATVIFLLERGANPDLPVYSMEIKRGNWYESQVAQAFSLELFEIGLCLLRHGAHPEIGNIRHHEAALHRLKRCLLPDKSGLIKFTIEFLGRLANKTMPRRPPNLGYKPFNPLERLLSQPSLEFRFVAHALLRVGFQIPRRTTTVLRHLAYKSSWIKQDVELIVMCYPFMDLGHIEKRKLDCVVRSVENEIKGARLFSRDDSPVLQPEPGTVPQYDMSETMQRWRNFLDMEFDKYVEGMRLRSGRLT
ncbi:Ankyrin repeat [Fusarium oxysporum f. sp. vasinfectum]|nr:Ankyrin repeat [Fusarium oxysporum f. sp. vasinfectum]